MHLPFGKDFAKMHVIKWHDKRDVYVLSSMHDGEFKNVVSRKPNVDAIDKPVAVVEYNNNMYHVDRSDQMMQYQAFRRRTLKWYRKGFFHFFNLAILNAYLLYRMINPTPVSQKVFRRILSHSLIGETRIPPTVVLARSVNVEARLTERHFLKKIQKRYPNGSIRQRKCVVCCKYENKVRTFRKSYNECRSCDVGLCFDPCFELFHTQKDYKQAYVDLQNS